MLEHTTDKSLLTSNTLQLYQQLIYFIANHFHCLMKTNERIPDLNDGLYYLDLWATIPYMENIFQNSWNILKNSTKTCLFFLTNTFTNKNTDVIWWLIYIFYFYENLIQVYFMGPPQDHGQKYMASELKTFCLLSHLKIKHVCQNVDGPVSKCTNQGIKSPVNCVIEFDNLVSNFKLRYLVTFNMSRGDALVGTIIYKYCRGA